MISCLETVTTFYLFPINLGGHEGKKEKEKNHCTTINYELQITKMNPKKQKEKLYTRMEDKQHQASCFQNDYHLLHGKAGVRKLQNHSR